MRTTDRQKYTEFVQKLYVHFERYSGDNQRNKYG